MKPTPSSLLAPVLAAVAALALAAPAAWAGDAPKPSSPGDAVAHLARAVEEGDRSWEELFRLYSEAKTALDDAKDEAVKEEAQAAYDAIRPQVAEALERDRVPMSGWFMGVFAALLLWGGFGWCLRLAMKSTPQHELDEDETWPIRPEEP